MDEQRITADDGFVPPGILSLATLHPEMLGFACAVGLGVGAVALRRYRNPYQQTDDTDIEAPPVVTGDDGI